MTKIDYDTAVKDVQEIIKGREDYVYVNPFGKKAGGEDGLNCYYFDPNNGQPSCIVGHVFAKHGVTFEDVGVMNDNCIMDAIYVAGIDLDYQTRYFLEAIQERQDSGVPWGESVSRTMKEDFSGD